MDELIPIINKLQDVFNTIGYDPIDLPQIVVIGSQSSGKSSVIENLVGKDFLPRGADIVTRRPLVLQLIHRHASGENTPRHNTLNIPPGSSDLEWGEFLHVKGGAQFRDFEHIKKEIETETIRVAGSNKNISSKPIHLKIYSPNVVNLTLVDLPGITKIPVGDQPTDIEQQLRQMIVNYIRQPNSIILAVTSANVDLANSDALKLAREVDPDGIRTVGVLTKLDLMDAGTNAVDVLLGRCIPLKLGYIAVVNRSQQDIIDGKPIREALRKEMGFFKNHPAYKSLANRCGTSYLAKTLNRILMHHIRDRLPELKSKIQSMILQSEHELLSFGDSVYSGKAHRGSLLLSLLNKFNTSFVASIDGSSKDVSTTELCGGARISYIFRDIFIPTLDRVDPCGGLSPQDIRIAIRNSTGAQPCIFVPEISFELLVKKQMKRLEAPSLRCAEMVFEELLRIIHRCEKKDLSQFPNLARRISEVASELLREKLPSTNEMVERLIAIELAYINTNHPDFMGGTAALTVLEKIRDKRKSEVTSTAASTTTALMKHNYSDMFSQDKRTADTKDTGFLHYLFGNREKDKSSNHDRFITGDSTAISSSTSADKNPTPFHHETILHDTKDGLSSISMSEKEELETHLIQSLIYSYFCIVRRNVQDLVPKSIMCCLVNAVKDALSNRLISELYREDLFGDLLQEDPRVAQERLQHQQVLAVLKKAADIVHEVREGAFVK